MDKPEYDDEGLFVFKGLGEEGYIEVELIPAEREMLRPLAEPGQPIWKIMQGMLDLSRSLKHNLAMLELGDPRQLSMAAKISTEIKAIEWQHRLWTRILAKEPTQQEQGTAR